MAAGEAEYPQSMRDQPGENNEQSHQLRMAAEAKLDHSHQQLMSGRPLEELLHELQVHQLELEMQNEALRQSKLALEETRDRFVDLYEFAPVGYLALTADGMISAVNLTCTRLMGMSRSELLHRSFSAFIADEDLSRWPQSCIDPNETEDAVTLEVLMRRGDHSQFDAQLVCTRRGGRIFRIALSDISERKQAEEKLRAAMAEAESANNAKSRFLAAASHDLRQPLAALRLYTNALQETVAPAQRALVAGMDDCVTNLSGLLTDLLDLSKLDAGVVKPNISDFSVFEFLTSLESVFYLQAQGKGLDLRFHASSLTGRSDPVLLKRIISNIIENALRYTKRGGVLVGCRRQQGKVWIEVRDSGIGIAADHIAVIFEDFRQLGDQARNRGSGLGLAIVAKAAAVLGLKVRVRSLPGRGSVFAVELPLGEHAVTPDQTPQRSKCRALRIALVDDNAMVREAMVLALQCSGHQVVAAADSRGLLAELGTRPPDIIVSDYRLAHGENGYSAITDVRNALGGNLPALVITGDTDPKLMASMAERGIVVLYKPLSMEKLQDTLDDLIG